MSGIPSADRQKDNSAFGRDSMNWMDDVRCCNWVPRGFGLIHRLATLQRLAAE
jgi:hypothetical protein